MMRAVPASPLARRSSAGQLQHGRVQGAADQGAFWEMHDLLLANQDRLLPRDLIGYADELGLDTERFGDYIAPSAAACLRADASPL
jgi:protein-disulfide isomerase